MRFRYYFPRLIERLPRSYLIRTPSANDPRFYSTIQFLISFRERHGREWQKKSRDDPFCSEEKRCGQSCTACFGNVLQSQEDLANNSTIALAGRRYLSRDRAVRGTTPFAQGTTCRSQRCGAACMIAGSLVAPPDWHLGRTFRIRPTALRCSALEVRSHRSSNTSTLHTDRLETASAMAPA